MDVGTQPETRRTVPLFVRYAATVLRPLAFLLLAVLGPPAAQRPAPSEAGATDEVAPPAPRDTELAAPTSETADDASCDPPEPGFLTLDTRPWTVVYVDGVYAGSTPLFRHKLAPGAHTLTLVNEGAGVLTHEDIVVDEGRTRRLRLLLVADAVDATLDASRDASVSADDCILPDEDVAWLSVDTRPWSRVFVDGKRRGSTPLFEVPISRGEHVVRLESEDGTSAFARFTATAGETVRLSLALPAR